MPESRPHEEVVQDDHAEADPLADSHRGLFCSLDLKDAYFHIQIAPPSQKILEIRLRGSGLSVHGPSLWTVPGPPHFYEVHGRGSLPSKTDGNPHSQLPRRLAHSGSVRGGTALTQNPPPQPLRVPGAQGQSCQERSVPQPTGIVPGNSSRLSSNESCDSTGTRSGHSETCGLFRKRHHSPPQSVSENARPHDRSIVSATVEPASHATPSALVETTGSTSRMASRTSACQGEPGLCNSPGPWKDPLWMNRGVAMGIVCNRKVVTTDASNTGWGGRCAKANRPSAIG